MGTLYDVNSKGKSGNDGGSANKNRKRQLYVHNDVLRFLARDDDDDHDSYVSYDDEEEDDYIEENDDTINKDEEEEDNLAIELAIALATEKDVLEEDDIIELAIAAQISKRKE